MKAFLAPFGANGFTKSVAEAVLDCRGILIGTEVIENDPDDRILFVPTCQVGFSPSDVNDQVQHFQNISRVPHRREIIHMKQEEGKILVRAFRSFSLQAQSLKEKVLRQDRPAHINRLTRRPLERVNLHLVDISIRHCGGNCCPLVSIGHSG